MNCLNRLPWSVLASTGRKNFLSRQHGFQKLFYSTSAAQKPKPESFDYPRIIAAKYTKNIVGIRSTRGMRSYNEDRYRVGHLTQDSHYLGLFDGHGGSRSADFAAAHLHDELFKILKKRKFGEPNKSLGQIVSDGICATSHRLDIHAADEQFNDGTTVTVALFRGNILAVGNVGDSRIVKVGKSGAKTITAIHKPNSPGELERIESYGGEVVTPPGSIPRINGQLGLSRALGDLPFRRFGLIPDAEVNEYQITNDDAFLIMATDGLWDTFNEEEAADIVRTCKTPCDAAQKLLYECEVAGGEDNCTIMVVKLPGWYEQTGKSSVKPAIPNRARNRLS